MLMIIDGFGKQLNLSYQIKVGNAHKQNLLIRMTQYLMTSKQNAAAKNLNIK